MRLAVFKMRDMEYFNNIDEITCPATMILSLSTSNLLKR